MIKAGTAKEITLKNILVEKKVNLTDVDSHLDFIVQEAAKEGKTEIKITKEEMKDCKDLFRAVHDTVIRTEIRSRYEKLGYQVRINRDERMKISDLTLNWG